MKVIVADDSKVIGIYTECHAANGHRGNPGRQRAGGI
jgi:hypothetical protein